MTERGLPTVDGAPACPFVAFAEDRDERATSPDHRHRCYAEATPAPRALAHQEAYCLASAFPVCPTFQDWARREAARARAEASTPAPGPGAEAPRDPGSQRNPPRDWAAPPPWLSSEGASPGDAELDEVRPIPPRGGGLAGSFADRVASGAERPLAAAAPPVTAASPAQPEPDQAPEPVAPVAIGARGPESGGQRRRDAAAPEWERPRPLEDYPAIRTRRLSELSLSPILIAFVALLLAAVVLFALPGLLGFGGPGGPAATPTPSAPAATTEPSVEPTPEPPPTPIVYVVQQGDTMSKIAARFGVPLQALIDANSDNIPNPDRLDIGDQVIIPGAVPTQIPGDLPAAS